jgi:spermidine synthase
MALARSGELAAALESLREAVRLRPDLAPVRAELGLALIRTGALAPGLAHLDAAVELEPGAAEFRLRRGEALLGIGRAREAAAEFAETLRLDPGRIEAANDLAWIRATHPDPGLRDPEEAVALAERAVRGRAQPGAAELDTLAAAYAAAGRFEEAIATAERAIAAPGATPELVAQVRARLALFRAGRPYLEPAAGESPAAGPARGDQARSGL